MLVTGLMFGLRRYGEPTREEPPWKLGIGALGVAGAAVLVLALPRPAVPVLLLGIVVVVLRRSPWRDVVRTTSPLVLAALFAVAVALGMLARTWEWPGDLANDHGRWAAAVVAAGGSVLVNNLPASVLLSARVPLHRRSLLIGTGPHASSTRGRRSGRTRASASSSRRCRSSPRSSRSGSRPSRGSDQEAVAWRRARPAPFRAALPRR